MRDLSASWSQDGAKVLQRVAKENPSSYFAVCARLLPSDVAISIQAQAPSLDARDLSILRAIKQAIPNANDRTANEAGGNHAERNMTQHDLPSPYNCDAFCGDGGLIIRCSVLEA